MDALLLPLLWVALLHVVDAYAPIDAWLSCLQRRLLVLLASNRTRLRHPPRDCLLSLHPASCPSRSLAPAPLLVLLRRPLTPSAPNRSSHSFMPPWSLMPQPSATSSPALFSSGNLDFPPDTLVDTSRADTRSLTSHHHTLSLALPHPGPHRPPCSSAIDNHRFPHPEADRCHLASVPVVCAAAHVYLEPRGCIVPRQLQTLSHPHPLVTSERMALCY